ncbi:DUF3592 domain-containing protein [Flavobacterium sp. LC2016-01]|uniref:DUF3592 domain-containing protein n=1 Tax=Flavobacterium sp. LC2016-01 TaxID=2675876 RepID=UPI0012BAB63C|nr:DUF3592 domain-containing protein [Flavobacterium sp. LC2016-01]MTH15439.1 DUF3592 domain-containing protein [Flavobacterium sp. LC2016-01]
MTENETWIVTKMKGYGCIGVFFLPFILVGIWTLGYSLNNIYNSQKTGDWTKVPATVAHIKLDYDNDSDGGDGTYEVKIGYKYKIGNKEFLGHKIAIGYSGGNGKEHVALFSKLENAKKIAVFVNPDDSSEAIIIKGINNSIVGVLVFSIMWNSFISFCLIPLFLKKGAKFNVKYAFIAFAVIWVTGFYLLFSDSIKIHSEDKIEVVESKKISDTDV